MGMERGDAEHHYVGLCGVQAEELFDDEEQADHSG
jgi:hypothetical protein